MHLMAVHLHFRIWGENLQLTIQQAGSLFFESLHNSCPHASAAFQVQSLSKQLENIGEMYKDFHQKYFS
jgi:hypothetical protein